MTQGIRTQSLRTAEPRSYGFEREHSRSPLGSVLAPAADTSSTNTFIGDSEEDELGSSITPEFKGPRTISIQVGSSRSTITPRKVPSPVVAKLIPQGMRTDNRSSPDTDYSPRNLQDDCRSASVALRPKKRVSYYQPIPLPGDELDELDDQFPEVLDEDTNLTVHNVLPAPPPAPPPAPIPKPKRKRTTLANAPHFRVSGNEGYYMNKYGPALPCLHCCSTKSNTWIPDPKGGPRRICNACWAYQKKYDGRVRPLSYQDFRTIPKSAAKCDNCATPSARDWQPDENGRRLCTTCKKYAKAHHGAMRPAERKFVPCERCSEGTTRPVKLSNLASVCEACHDDIFAGFDFNSPLGRPEIPEDQPEDGETFFDHCLLIYAWKIGPTLPKPEDKGGITSKHSKPCKGCQATTACRWRPALDHQEICESCYRGAFKFIRKYDLQEHPEKEPTGVLATLRAGFACPGCHTTVGVTKWRVDFAGDAMCSTCFDNLDDS